MYLRTKYAWYILDMPSSTYSPFFIDFWLQHRILHLAVTAAMANGRITYDAFVASLKVTPETSDAIAIAIKVLGRELTEDDVESDDVVRFALVLFHGQRSEDVPGRNRTSSSRWTNSVSKKGSESNVSLSSKLCVADQAFMPRTPHDPLHGLLERNLHNHQSLVIPRPRCSSIVIRLS